MHGATVRITYDTYLQGRILGTASLDDISAQEDDKSAEC